MAVKSETGIDNDIYISDSDLYNIFQGHSFDLNYLIFDIAISKNQYTKSHIISAIHLDCHKIRQNKNNTAMLQNIEFKDLKTSHKLKQWSLSKKNIVIYNHNNETKQNDDEKKDQYKTENINIFHQLKLIFDKTKISSFKILKSNYNQFYNEYPYLCITNKQKNKRETVPYLPSEIIPKQLYLTNKTRASKLEIMQLLNITHCINVTEETPNFFENSKQINIKYIRIPIKDTLNTDILSYFTQTNKFIDNVIDNGGIVLVHCQMGKSRSATIVSAYLIYKYKYSVQTAIEYVKTRRYVANPNDSFIKQLQQFHVSLQ
eukprot:277379_1